MTEDFIKSFKEVVSDYTDAPDALKEITALTTLSGLIGHNVVMAYEPKTRVFSKCVDNETLSGMFFNLYAFVIGKSRITRKSTTTGFMLDLIENVDENLLITQSFTPEALIDELKEKQSLGYAHAVWVVDEAARFYEACRKKDYMGEAQSLIQQLYDGRSFSRRTRGSGLITIKNPYFVSLFSTTPFVVEENLVKPSDFHHGFLNRFLILKIEPTEKWKEISFSGTEIKIEDASKLLEKAKILRQLEKPLIVHPSGDVIKAFNNFDADIKDLIMKSEDATYQSYIGNFSEFLVKLMGLYRVSQVKKVSGIGIVPIEMEDYERALKFLQNVQRSFMDIKAEIDKSSRTKPFTPIDTSKWEDLVFGLIKSHGSISRYELLRAVQRYGINAQALKTITSELENKDLIAITTEHDTKRPRMVFKII